MQVLRSVFVLRSNKDFIVQMYVTLSLISTKNKRLSSHRLPLCEYMSLILFNRKYFKLTGANHKH